MRIFKQVYLHDDNGYLFAMVPYLRHLEEGAVSVGALGAGNDSLDDVILETIQMRYPNAHLYRSDEFTEEQIEGTLKSFGNIGDKEVVTLLIVSNQVFTIPLTVWIAKNIHFQDREKIVSEYIKFKTEKVLNPKQIESVEALSPPE